MGQVNLSLAQQLRYLSRDDIEMLQQRNEVLQKQFLKNNQSIDKKIWTSFLDIRVGSI